MIIIPIILTAITFSCLVLVVIGVTGMDVRNIRNSDYFYNLMQETEELVNIDNLQDLMEEVDKLNSAYNNNGIDIAIYENDILIYPESNDVIDITKVLLSGDVEYLLIDDNYAVYNRYVGDYTLLLTSTNYSLYPKSSLNQYFYMGIFFFLFVVVIILIINRILTQSVTKKITTPIEILVSGVHELRDGNLNFRIQYDNNDEFKQVCHDFNEMAQHLSDMVIAKQKDEENRKELIAGISHDLRTPLTSIKAYLEGIEKGVATTPQIQKRYFETIKGKTEDLEHIIDQLFMFSKLDIGEFPLRLEEVEIGKVLSDFCEQVTNEYKERGLFLSFRNSDVQLFSNIDIGQFRSVLSNILENSVKYKINDDVKSEVEYYQSDSNIEITITDNGTGVPEENIDKLFDVFYRGDISRKDPSSGSGLGLAISRKIIERIGGTISAKNAESGGLTIMITLPMVHREV